MADYWKSNERKYCDFCKCWISDNKASIAFHENGKRHKLNVAKRITDISRNSEKAEQDKRKMDLEIRKMEEAAMRSYAMDIHCRGDMTAKTLSTVMAAGRVGPTVNAPSSETTVAGTSRYRQQDPLRLAGPPDSEDYNKCCTSKTDYSSIPNASLWVEGKNDDGFSYYWNVKTNESIWDPPKEGFLSWKEYQKINELAIKQQELQQAQEAKQFRENVNEEVAKFNRERLKVYQKPATKQELKAEEEQKKGYKTEEDVKAPQMGQWQVVENKPPTLPVDLELPKIEHQYIAHVVSDTVYEPPIKRFKEKTVKNLDSEETIGTSVSFKKRKFAAKGNARKRLEDE